MSTFVSTFAQGLHRGSLEVLHRHSGSNVALVLVVPVELDVLVVLLAELLLLVVLLAELLLLVVLLVELLLLVVQVARSL